MNEGQLHRAVAEFLNLALPPECVWHHSPMEGAGRGPITGAILKRMGAKAGWPDLEFVYAGEIFFIELKAPKRNLTPAQHQTMTSLSMAGAYTAVCRSLDEVETTLSGWGIPLKARAA